MFVGESDLGCKLLSSLDSDYEGIHDYCTNLAMIIIILIRPMT